MSIPYQQVVRTETAIADAVIKKMKASDDRYVPLNFIKGTLPYHIDNMIFLRIHLMELHLLTHSSVFHLNHTF